MVKIRSGIDTATIQNGVWECDSPVFLELLRAVTENNPVGPQHPWRDYRRAEIFIERFGGEIIETHRPPPPGGVEGVDFIF